LFLLLAAAAAFSCGEIRSRHLPGVAVAQSEPVNPWLDSLVFQYDRYLKGIIADTLLPGAAAAITYGDRILLCRGYGQRSVEDHNAVDAHTVFRIGSLSKGFTGVLAGLLVEEGLLRWEDPVRQYLPEFRLKTDQATRQLNLRHLLSHTTGLPQHAFTDLVEDGRDLPQMIESLRDVDMAGRLGETYAYQNVVFSLSGEMMQAVTGRPVDELFRERIFRPLRMVDASTSFDALVNTRNKALPHLRRKSGWKVKEMTSEYYNTLPAGGINASISDMSKWLIALSGKRPGVISPEILDTLFTPEVRTPIRARYRNQWQPLGELWYGLGWRIFERGGFRIVYHGGLVNGYRGEIALHPAYGLGVCVLMNAPSATASEVVPAFLNLCDQYADSIAAWERSVLPL
jgi:beta-lactamase class C